MSTSVEPTLARKAWVVGGYAATTQRSVTPTLNRYGIEVVRWTPTGAKGRSNNTRTFKASPPKGVDLLVVLATSISHAHLRAAKEAAKKGGLAILSGSHKEAELVKALEERGYKAEPKPKVDDSVVLATALALEEYTAWAPGGGVPSFRRASGYTGMSDSALRRRLSIIRDAAGIRARAGRGKREVNTERFIAWCAQRGLTPNFNAVNVTWTTEPPTEAGPKPAGPAPELPPTPEPAPPTEPEPEAPRPVHSLPPADLGNLRAAVELVKEAMAKNNMVCLSIDEHGVRLLRRVVVEEEVTL